MVQQTALSSPSIADLVRAEVARARIRTNVTAAKLMFNWKWIRGKRRVEMLGYVEALSQDDISLSEATTEMSRVRRRVYPQALKGEGGKAARQPSRPARASRHLHDMDRPECWYAAVKWVDGLNSTPASRAGAHLS